MSAASEPTRTTAVSASLLFAVIAAFVVLKSARDALFLGVFPAAVLPYLFIANAGASAGLAAVYVRFLGSHPTRRTLAPSLALCAAGTLLFWLAARGGSRPTIVGLYLWVGLIGTLLPVQAWSLVSERLLPREARRTLGILGAGASLGGSAGGFLARFCSTAWGAPALLVLGALLLLSALAVALRFPREEAAAARSREPGPQARLGRRFAILLFLVVAAGSLVSTLVDFQFKVIAQRDLQTPEALAALFGSFYAYAEVATLAFQIVATPFLLRSLSLSATLPLLPAALLAGNALVLAVASLPSALFLKASEQVLKQSLDRSSREILYLPVPPRAKRRLKSLVETLGVRVPEAVAALALVLLVSVGQAPPRAIASLTLVLVSAWAVAAVLLGRQYPEVLKAGILQHEIDFSEVRDAVLGRDFYRLLPDLVRSSKPETLLHILELMGTTGDRTLGPSLRPFLEHSDPRVRHAALELLMTQRDDLSSTVEDRLSDDDLGVRTEAVHYLCMRCAPGAMNKLDALLAHADPQVQVAAAACALNEADQSLRDGGLARLDGALTLALEQGRPEVRLEIAHVLAHAGPAPGAQSLFRRLLSDSDRAVRRGALRGLSRARVPGLAPVLLQALDDPRLRAEARQALANHGAEALSEVMTALASEASAERRKVLVQVLADIGGDEAVRQLLARSSDPEATVRFAALKALNRLRRGASLGSFLADLEALLEREAGSLEGERERIAAFGARPGGVMERVLQEREGWARERVFRALGLLYEPQGIHDAYRALTSGDVRRRELALEYLATTLGVEHRSRILALLETARGVTAPPDPEQRAAVLFGYLRDRDALGAAAAAAELGREEIGAWRGEIERCLSAAGGSGFVEEALRRSRVGGDMTGRDVPHDHRLTTVQRMEHLARVDIFAGLGAQELLVVAERSEEVEFEAGETVFREGAPATEVYSIVSGSIELCREAGKVEVLGPGDSFGTLAALVREPRFFTACALEWSRCLRLHRDTFREILEAYPRAAQGVIETLVRKVEALTERVQSGRDGCPQP